MTKLPPVVLRLSGQWVFGSQNGSSTGVSCNADVKACGSEVHDYSDPQSCVASVPASFDFAS